jgi:hypothetical protein
VGAALAVVVVLAAAVLLVVAVSIAGSLGKIAELIERQNKHYFDAPDDRS